MADNISGEIFDLEIKPVVDTSALDDLDERLNKYEEKPTKIKFDPEFDIKENKKAFEDLMSKDFEIKINPKTVPALKQVKSMLEEIKGFSENSIDINITGNENLLKYQRTKEFRKFSGLAKSYANIYGDGISDITADFLEKNELDSKNIENLINAYKKHFANLKGIYNELSNIYVQNVGDQNYENIISAPEYTGLFDNLLNPNGFTKVIEEQIENVFDELEDKVDKALLEGINKSAFMDVRGNSSIVNRINKAEKQLRSKTVAVSQAMPVGDNVTPNIGGEIKLKSEELTLINNNVGHIFELLKTGGVADSKTDNKKLEVEFDSSELVSALSDLSDVLKQKKSIIDADKKAESILKDPTAKVTEKELQAAVEESKRNVTLAKAAARSALNSTYKKIEGLISQLKEENAQIYDSLGNNFLDISKEELQSFVEMIDKIQDKTITIDVDIPNIKDVQGLLLTLHKAEKAEKEAGKGTKSKTTKSKTKAVEPAVASKGDLSGEPNGATLPKNLNITNEEGNKLLTSIKTSVESIDSKLGKDGKVSVAKSRTKKSNDNSQGIPAGALKTLSDSFSSFGDSIKQIEGGVDLIFEQTDEVANNTKSAINLLDSIYNKISSGVTVTGGAPIPSSNNSPTPIPQGNNGGTPRNRSGNNPKPANTPPASTRSRDNIIDETNRLLPEINSEIKKINYLLASEGGVSDAILSENDAKDLLNRLKEVESELSNIQNTVWSKKVGQKTLAAADSDLTDVMSTYSSINIPQEVDTYNKVFGNFKSINRAEEMLGTLTRFKELLNTKGIDTTAYDEAIQRLKNGIERVEETEKSWMSQKLDDSGLKLANDALTQVRDSLDGISDATESLFEYAKNEKSEFLSFDVKIDEIEELEKSLIRLDNLIKKAKSAGVDLTSVDMGNGQTLADAEKTIERYFSEKGSLSIYSPGQFASEAEFKSYREDIELNLIEPTKLYAKALGETEYAVNQLIQEQKELTKASNEYNKGLTLNKQISNKITELEKWRDANSKAFTIPENAAEYERFMNRLKDGTIIDQSQMKKFNAEWAEFNAQIRAAGQNGKTTGSILTAMFKKFGGWTLVTRIITQGIRLMKDMVVQVNEVDTAMVNLRKVTDASEQSLLKYQKSVQKSSIALGTTLTDQIDSTAIFSRLGYQLEEAQKLGEIASKYKTVAEDLDINTASESIISTMKAYQSMGDTAEEIVDKFNYVGKELPSDIVIYHKQVAISVKTQRWVRPR